jgi:uncharacterized alpha-E superfamily protein
MLSRIANSLLWMGRYLERAQHTARYVHVHYFSALDAPHLSKKEYVLDSISCMTGLSYEYDEEVLNLEDQNLIYKITLDETNPVSIKSFINNARENARGARDILSSELWESINKFYHSANAYQGKTLTEEEILSFTEMVVHQCAIVHGYIDHSLLHDDTWSLIQLGIHTEAAGQLTRMLIAKVRDIEKTEQLKLGKAMETYQCITMLKSAEGYDMSRVHYKSVPNLKKALEFLILNKDFPRSIIFNLEAVNRCLQKINLAKGEDKNSVEFFAGKLHASYSYLTIEEIKDQILPFLEKTLDDLYKLGTLVDQKIS